MLLLGFITVAWLVLVTAAVVGLNVRIAILRSEQRKVTALTLAADGEDRSSNQPQRTPAALKVRGSAMILQVSETCRGCIEMIEAFTRLAANDNHHARYEWVVLSPAPDDARVEPPLRLDSDPQTYRELFPGVVPAVFHAAPSGTTRLLGAPVSSSHLSELVASVDPRE